MGGYERDPAPWSLDGIPPDFNGKLLAPDMARFESIMEGAIRRVPAMADAGVNRVINGPEGFTPDNEFILGESEVRGFFVAAGFSAHGIAGAGGIGRQMASWIVDGEPELDLWKMDIRRFGPAYRSQAYTLARSIENYATYYDIHYPNEERQAGRPLRMAPTYEILDGARRVVRREVRLGAPELVRVERRRRRRGRSGRAAGRASTGRRRSAPRRWPRAGRPACSTRPRSPSSRSSGRARSRSCSRCAPTTSTCRSARIVVHAAAEPPRRDRVRPDRDPGRRPTATCSSPGRRSGSTTWRGCAGTCRATGRARSTTSPRGASASRCGARGRATSSRRVDARRRLRRRLPVPHRARDHRRLRAGLRAARHLRRRARLGAVRPHRVRRGALADALGGGRAARPGRRRLPGDRRAPAREGLPRLVERHHPGRDAVRGRASGSRSRSTRAPTSSAATRSSRRRRPARASGCAASSSTTRARSASATSRSASTARSSAG